MSTITPKEMNVAPANTVAYYRLIYNASTKKVIQCVYGKGITYTTDAIFCATTWAEIQAEATTLTLTGLPADPNAGH